MNKYIFYGVAAGMILCIFLFAVGEVFGVTVMSFRGEWIQTYSYSVQDVVSYNGALYLAIKNNQGMYPDVSKLDWIAFTYVVPKGKK